MKGNLEVEISLVDLPVDGGFQYTSVESFPELQLSAQARQRVIEKMDSVAEVLRQAVEVGVSTYIQ